MMRYITSLMIAAVVLMGLLTSCGSSDPSDTGLEYAPNMFHSIPLEPYSQQGENPIFANGLNAQKAPDGTLPRSTEWLYEEDYVPYHLPNSPEGYDSAKLVTSPIECSDVNLEKGKQIYETFCIVCHGAKGEAGGKIVVDGPYPPPPSYKSDALMALPDGQMFHSITHGKNLMGSYASQVSPKERWQVICYINYLQTQ